MEQYGRSLCVRVGGAPTVDNKASDEVLEKMKTLTKETSCVNPDVVIDRARQTGKDYNNKKTNIISKIIIVRFTILRQRTMFNRSRANLNIMSRLS